jgi:hypothetical protein
MLKTQALVHTFMKATGLPLPNEERLSIEGLRKLNFPLLRKLVREEAKEFRDWMIALEEALEVYKDTDSDNYGTRVPVLKAWAEVIDAMCDTIVVVHNTSNAMGIDLEPFYDEVHRTNMAKVGGPKDADGKQLKPEGWEGPRILELLSAEVATRRVYQTVEVPRTLFVIIKHEFDSMENRNPWVDEVVAVAGSALEATRTIQALQLGTKTFQGWDGKTYPSWSYQEIPDVQTFLARLPAPPPPVPIESDEGLPPLKFKTGDRITVHLNDEQGRVGGVVTEVRRYQPYPPGFGPTHGVMVSAVLDCNVVTGLMPESAFEFETCGQSIPVVTAPSRPVHIGVDLSVKPSETVWAKVETEGGEVKKVERLHPPFEVGDRVVCTFNEALGEIGVVKVLDHRGERWCVRVEMEEESRRPAFDGFLPATLFLKCPAL